VIGLVVLLYMLIASSFTFGKLGLQYLDPIFFVGVRMLLSGILLLGYLYLFRRSKLTFNKEHTRDFAAIILFHIFFAFVLEFWALQYLSSSKVCLFYNLSPFISALFSYFWFAEKMTFKKLIGLSIGFFAFAPVLMSGGVESLSVLSFLSWPELFMLISVASAVYGWIIMRKLGRQGYSILMVNGVGMLGGGLLALLTSFVVEGMPRFKMVSGSLLTDLAFCSVYMLALIVLSNVVFYNLYGFLLHRFTATLLSFAGFLTPIFAAIFGLIFLGERVGWSFFTTVFLVFWGLYIFYQEELRQGYIVGE